MGIVCFSAGLFFVFLLGGGEEGESDFSPFPSVFDPHEKLQKHLHLFLVKFSSSLGDIKYLKLSSCDLLV